jgi:hypothetical protein
MYNYIILILIIALIYVLVKRECYIDTFDNDESDSNESDVESVKPIPTNSTKTLRYNEDFTLDESDFFPRKEEYEKYALNDQENLHNDIYYENPYDGQNRNQEAYLQSFAAMEMNNTEMNTIEPAITSELKTVSNQLTKQQQMDNELRNKYETPDEIKYNYFASDRYIMDPNYKPVGDDVFTTRTIENGKRSKQAIDNRIMWSTHALIPYLEEEMRDHSKSIWWDDDALDDELTNDLLV